MAMVCLLFDLLGLIALIPFIGTVIDWLLTLLAETLFYFWLKSHNVTYLTTAKGLVATGIAGLVEFFFGFLPAISLQFGTIIATSWAEDALTAEISKTSPENTTTAQTSARENDKGKASRQQQVPTI